MHVRVRQSSDTEPFHAAALISATAVALRAPGCPAFWLFCPASGFRDGSGTEEA